MRVLIEFMPALGDFVTQLPILHALHEKIEPLDVEVVVERTGAALLADYDWVGRRYVKDGNWSAAAGRCLSSYANPYDIFLYLRSNPAIKLSRHVTRATRKLGPECYDRELIEAGAVPHRYSILRHVLSEPLPEISNRVHFKDERMSESSAIPDDARILCLGPGAGKVSRLWPVSRFARVAREIQGDFDQIAVVGSPDESHLCDDLADRTGGQSLSRLSLPGVAALLARCALYLGNDSGLAHLAAAQGCPTVAIGIRSDRYYTPWRSHAIMGRVQDISESDVLKFLRSEDGLG